MKFQKRKGHKHWHTGPHQSALTMSACSTSDRSYQVLSNEEAREAYNNVGRRSEAKTYYRGGGIPAKEWSKNPLPSLTFENPFELFQSKIGGVGIVVAGHILFISHIMLLTDAMDDSGRPSELVSAGSSDNDAMGQLDEDEEAAKIYDLDTGFHGMRIKTGVLGGSDPEMQRNIDRAKALDGMNYDKSVLQIPSCLVLI
jgi:hypothetical protein